MMKSSVAIVTIVMAVAGCAGAASPSGAGTAAAPSPASTSGPTLSVAPVPSVEATTPIPDELRHVWLGPARDISALGGPQAVSILLIEDATFYFIFGAHGEDALNSTVSIAAPGEVRFVSTNTTGGCHVGDEGIYDWTTSADGAGLTMTKVTEACSPRAEAVVGDWVRAACKSPDFGCLGNLEAGTHRTAFLEPLGQPAAFGPTWRMLYGQLSYTVPSGWANAVDDPNLYNLVAQDEYAKTVPDVSRYPGIVIVPDVAVAAQDAACSPKVEPGVGQSSAEIAARIARIPSLAVGSATSISISGRSGTMIDVALKPGWAQSCAVGGGVPVLRRGDDEWRMTATSRWRLILVDVADGRTMAILIGSFDDLSRFDDLVADAMPIVQSFDFTR
jgi:hypothetical protein